MSKNWWILSFMADFERILSESGEKIPLACYGFLRPHVAAFGRRRAVIAPPVHIGSFA